MKRVLVLFVCSVLAAAFIISFAPAASAAGPHWIIVSAGETLYSIAARHGTTVDALIRANNLPNPNFVFSGQRLFIPGAETVSVAPAASNAPTVPQTAPTVYYTVRPGDTLAAIALRYGVTPAAIAQANGLTNWNFVWYGQRLQIPGATNVNGVAPPPAANSQPSAPQPNTPPPNPLAAPAVNPPTTGKWIDVNVTQQTITAYEGTLPLKTVLVSTGLPRTPTVLGTFKILRKYPAVHMTGGTPGYDYYDLPNVPYTMFFYQGYAIHGTYWHSNFGHPMSHGCVNAPTEEAKWFYEWAPVGTPVVSHR
ncbi:MAG: LysM peptidoglycan-binding domain-containing protein [Chloroflexi bacterium]|nr:LysM peptidoglycan-binding domain-containing protein [Chloroflexota bacterium]